MMHVAGLWRYPVKSLAGEPLDRACLERTGVPADRRVRVMGPEGVRTARRHYRLLGLQGGLGADGRPTIDGHAWDSLQALALVRNAAGADAWLGFENAYAFAMPRAQAQRLGVRRLSDLIPHAPRLRAGGDYEFWSRSEWRDVRAAYGIDFAERRSMDPALMYTAIEQGQVDLISAFSSDGRLAALDLVTLEDDRGAIPPYDAMVIVGRSLRRARPDVVAALGELDGRIPVEQMRASNLAVDGRGRSPAVVAAELLSALRHRRGSDAAPAR